MALNYINRKTLRDIIAFRLGDLQFIHWSQDEINYFINDALYTFGALGNYFKELVVFPSVAGQVYYDLSTVITNPVNKLNFNLTANYIIQGINYHLIENISDINQSSAFISRDEILKILRNKIVEMQLAAGLILTKTEYPVASPPVQEVALSDDVIDIIRVVFKQVSLDSEGEPVNAFYILKEDTEQAVSTADINYNSLTRYPKWYTNTLTDSNQQLVIFPPASQEGVLEVVSVNAPTALVDSTSLISFCDNLVPYLRWGVMAEILNKDGELNDPNRAAYCATRWQEGIFIAKQYTSILKATANSRPSTLDSIDNIDSNDGKWPNRIGTNRAVSFGLAGYNMLIPSRIPSGVEGWAFNTVVNAPVPTADEGDGSSIQIKQEYLEPLIEYVVHILEFKDGLAELKRTQPSLEKFLKAGLQYNSRMAAKGINYQSIIDKTKIQEQELVKIAVDAPYQNQGANQ